MRKYLQKLLLNLATLSTILMLSYASYNAFTHKLSPVFGALFVIGLIIFLVFLLYLGKTRKFRHERPKIVPTMFALVGILLICTFAGVQPLSKFKDDTFTLLVQTWADVKTSPKSKPPTPTNEPKQNNKILTPKNDTAQDSHKDDMWRTIVEEKITEEKIHNVEIEVMDLVNIIRRQRNTKPLDWNKRLYEYSKEHSRMMSIQCELFHSEAYRPYAENAWGGENARLDAKAIVRSWMESDFHRTWLLNPHIKNIAVGIVASDCGIYASWTFWRHETYIKDWWYINDTNPPEWWH